MRTAPISLLLTTSLACATAPGGPAESASTERCGAPDTFLSNDAAPRPAREAAAARYLKACGRQEATALLADLVRFPTVSAEQSPKDGPAFAEMKAYLQDWSTAHGFRFDATPDDGAWTLTLGEGKPDVAWVMHADVVPVAKGEGGLPPGWSAPPFALTERNGRLYGRGTGDDKGPIAAVLVALDTLRRFGLTTDRTFQAILGTGEESDWDGMRAFLKTWDPAEHVISLDAEFPVVVAESGFVAWTLHVPRAAAPKPDGGCLVPVEARAGEFLTQVPGEATLTVGGPDAKARLQTAIDAARARRTPTFAASVTEAEAEGQATLRVEGVAVHSSVADEGLDAMWLLSAPEVSAELCAGPIRSLLEAVAAFFDADLYGARLGLAYDHPVMGALFVIPTVLRTEADKLELRVNMRRPAGRTKAEFEARLDAALVRLQTAVPGLVEAPKGRYVGEPFLADVEGPLVTTLVDIYREATGASPESEATHSIRGGTYARLFDGAVNFGPALPGRPYRGHAPDEYMEVEALELVLETTLQAALRLTR